MSAEQRGRALGYSLGARRRTVGLAAVVVLHILIFWALVSGLSRKSVEVVKRPIEMAIVPETPLPPPPPPPPPPPKVEKLREPPPPAAPPPPFVPPPDVPPPVQPPAPTLQATQVEPPKAPPVIAPPPPPAAPPAPPARAEIGVSCPGHAKTLQTALQGAFDKVGIEGTVVVQIRIKGNQIIDVTPISGPRDYYRIVQAAVRRLNCSSGTADEVVVPLEIVFREG